MGVAPQASPSDALFFICMSKEPYRELSACQSAEASFARLTEKIHSVRQFLRCIGK